MPRYSPTDTRQNHTRREGVLRRLHWWVVPVLLVAIAGGTPSCLFKKKKAAAPEVVPQGPIRLVFLPANITADNSEMRWLSLAVPVMLSKVSALSTDLDPVPLWQSMPIAVENAGAARAINPELASYVASRMGARWAAMGDLAPSKDGFTVIIDFIPVNTASYAYRYQKALSLSALESNLYQATSEFLNYRLPKPVIAKESRATMDTGTLRQIAEALDSDYGWFVPPAPGRGDAIAAGLSRSDSRLARLIFSPTLYPVVGAPPPPPQPTVPMPRIPPPPPESEKPPGTSSATPAPAEPGAQPVAPPAQTQAVSPERASDPATEAPQQVTSTLPVSQPLPSMTGAGGESDIAADSRGSPAAARAGPPSPSATSPAVEDKSRKAPLRNSLQPSESCRPPTSAPQLFRIQVASMRNRNGAENEAARFGRTDLTVEIVEADLGPKGTWYRVQVTGFQSRTEATNAGRRLKAEGVIQDFLIVP